MLRVKFGEKNLTYKESNGKVVTVPRGTAHFLEHKMFEDENGADMLTAFIKNGADANAFTGWDTTDYFFSGVSHFEDNLCLLLSMVSRSHFSKESVEKEKGIITEEQNSYLDDPMSVATNRAMRNMYEKLPFRYDLGGSASTIKKITPGILYKTHRLFYRPSNMVLSVCGNPESVFPERIMDMISDIFGTAADPEPMPDFLFPDEADRVARTHSVIRRPVGIKGFCLSFKGPSNPHASALKLSKLGRLGSFVLDMLLSVSSDLREYLNESGLIVGGLSYYGNIQRSSSYTIIQGWSPDPKTVTKTILEAIEETLKNGFDKENLERCIKVAKSSALLDFDSAESVAEIMISDNENGQNCFSRLHMYEEVTGEDCVKFLKKYLRPDRHTLVELCP